MKRTVEISDVFTAYGRASFYAQLIEYDLVSIWILESISQGVSLTPSDLQEFQADWSKKTLGQLFHPLGQSPMHPDDFKQFLEELRKTRNNLAHGFFLSAVADFRTPERRANALAELEQMTEVLMRGHFLFRQILTTYAKDFNIDCDAIQRRLLAQVYGNGDVLYSV